MKRILIAALAMVGVLLASPAIAAQCETHLGQVISDIAAMKKDPGWADGVVQPFDEVHVIDGMKEVYLAYNEVTPEKESLIRSDSRLLLTLSYPDQPDAKPNTLALWFDKNNCLISWGTIPQKVYNRAILTLQRGA